VKTKRYIRDDAGQTVVLVALMFTMLMGFGALSVDLGRFYAERRFIQDAADAAALACARNYAQGGTLASAWAAADSILQDRNLKGNPLGLSVTYAPQGSEVYDQNIVLEQNLIDGILPVNANGYGCRVAVTLAVPTYMIKVLNPALNTISMITRAYAKAKGGFLPSVVQRYANPPGPGTGAANQFIDHVMAENFDYLCTTSSEVGCVAASMTSKGREFVLFGQNAKATNDSSFRGYIGLDIRDFTSESGGLLVHEAYNGLIGTETVNTLKDYESGWIISGYPGPDICVVTPGNFDRCAQIAVINGSSSGIFVDDYNNHFRVGDILLLQLYDGTVKTVPDFSFTVPTLNVPATGAATSTVTYTYSDQFRISGATVTTTLIPDNGTLTTDGGGTPGINPFLNGCATPGSFTANPTPGGQNTYNQAWTGIASTACTKGIYQAWLRGESSAPYTSRIHETLVNVNVADQQRDYSLNGSDAYAIVASRGIQANLTIRVSTANSGSTKWVAGNAIRLSWAKCPTKDDDAADVLSCGIDGSFATSFVDNVDPGEDHVFNIDTNPAVATSGSYLGWVRARGDDENGKRVSHLLPVQVDINVTAGGVNQYVDVLGYAAFQVTVVNSNDVSGKAVTAAYYDPNDPNLAIAKKTVLVPWETP
jgi:Flp pilus assembly protein TadG